MTEPRKNGRQGRRYGDEFKRKAVHPLTTTTASAAEVSIQLGVSEGTLWRWQQLTATSTAAERPTYEELEHEVSRLRVENFFKKGFELLRLAPTGRY